MATSYHSYYRNRPQPGFLDQTYKSSSLDLPPFPLLFFTFILVLFLSLSWYLSYESVFEGLMDQIKMFVIVSPLVLLLVVQWLYSAEGRWMTPYLFPMPSERDHVGAAVVAGGGSSPWGVAVMLVVLLLMISYQSYFHERWFPLLSRV